MPNIPNVNEQLENPTFSLLPFVKKLVAATIATNIVFLIEYDFSGNEIMGLLAQASLLVSCVSICFYYMTSERLELVNMNGKLNTISIRFIKWLDNSLTLSIVTSCLGITLSFFTTSYYLGAFFLLSLTTFLVFVWRIKKIENHGDKVKLRKTKNPDVAIQPPEQNESQRKE